MSDTSRLASMAAIIAIYFDLPVRTMPQILRISTEEHDDDDFCHQALCCLLQRLA